MGRNKLVKRLVWLLVLITCIISMIILINLYVISTSEQHFLPKWEQRAANPTKDSDSSSEEYRVDPELVELEQKIQYILKLYQGGNRPKFGPEVDGQSVDTKNIKLKVSDHFHEKEKQKEKASHKSKFKFRFNFANARPALPPLQKRFRYVQKRTSGSVPGILNAHIWEGWCGPRVEDLKRDKHFPLYPSFKTNVSLFFAQWNEAGYGERIFGYLHPPETGNFIFAVSCDDNCEIWLSNSSSPKHAQKIAYVGTLNIPANTKLANFRQYQSQISREVYLKAGEKYYIEALHKQAAYKDHLLLTWLAPSWQRIRTISSKYISSYIGYDEGKLPIDEYEKYIPETLATHVGEQLYNNIGNIYYFNRTKYKFGSHDKRSANVSLRFVDAAQLKGVLPTMDYKPSYLLDFTPKRYEGVKLVHETAVYPNDNTVLTHMYPYEDCLTHRYNYPHLSEIEGASSVKTTIDKEYWFSQLSFNEKFKHLSTLYNKKIQYILHREERRKARMHGREENQDVPTDPPLQSDIEVHQGQDQPENQNSARNRNVLKSESSREEPEEVDIHEEEKAIKFEGSRNGRFVNRKLMSVVDGADQKQKRRPIQKKTKKRSSGQRIQVAADVSSKLDLQPINERIKKSQEDDAKKTPGEILNSPLETESVPEKGKSAVGTKKSRNHDSHDDQTSSNTINIELRPKKSYEVEDAGLPSNLAENEYRNRPINIPEFQRKDRDGDDLNSENADTGTTRKKGAKVLRRNAAYLTRKRIPPLLQHKVFYKDGVIINNTQYYNKTLPDRFQIARMYTVFGPAVYHLSQVPERHFQWLYNQHLSACKTDGNLQVSEEIAVGVVQEYMQKLKNKHGPKYTLRKIVNVEENHDVLHGDRYLIEIDVNVATSGKHKEVQHLSTYIFKPLGSAELFEIKNLRWNPSGTVHIIIPVKDQGRWVRHFISNMENIYRATKDPHLNIIIVDFNSTDIDIRKSLRNSVLRRYQVISLPGSFQRALGIQAGADTVRNPNDIIFACDLHLEIPSHLIASIRKHTVREKMAFAPMVFRLSCGYTPQLPFGLWEIQGYGLFAISKYDFDRIGGMNTKEFKTKWGGEDWEFLDRTLAFGLQVERMRIPHFFHYYHSKKRMWIAPKATLPPIISIDSS